MGGMFGGRQAKSPFDNLIQKSGILDQGWDKNKMPERSALPGGIAFDQAHQQRMNEYMKNKFRQLDKMPMQQPAAQPAPQPVVQQPRYDFGAADKAAFQGLSANNPYRAQLQQYFGGGM